MKPAPELLYITPVVPALTGNGLAMRAGMVLEALAARFSVSLLIVPLYPDSGPLPAELSRRCRNVEVLQPVRADRPRRALRRRFPWFGGQKVSGPYGEQRFDIVHVFRLIAMPWAAPFMAGPNQQPRLHLDIDDIESETHRRFAQLRRLNGDEPRALAEEAAAAGAETAENAAFRKISRLYVCSAADRARIQPRTPVEVCVLPNAVRIPPEPPTVGGPVRLLFIGTLGYYPNEDAAHYLCREIVPLLRGRSRKPFEVDIVGGGASDELRENARIAGVHLPGAVPEIGSWYGKATIVVSPIRAGGGTRIKILEAFSYRRPVISTSIGAQGIDARHAQEILLADTPAAFADSCVCLMEDHALAQRLAANAFHLAVSRYSLEALLTRL